MENSTERIEDLVSGRLSEVEASELNTQIAQDASLKEEFDFQERVINEISAVRERELKARLGALAVTTGGVTLMKKYLIAAGVAGVALVSTYLYTESDVEVVDVASNVENKVATTNNEVVGVEVSGESDVLAVDVKEGESSEEIGVTSTTTTTNEVVNIESKPKQDAVEQSIPEITIPGPVQGNDQDILISPDNDDSQGIETAVVNNSNNEVKVFPSAKKNRFHYKYEGSSVWVQIAGYSENKPALLINYPEKNELFLSYDKQFYELTMNSSWESLSVHEITNPQLIQQLKNKIK